mgnify:CR=1 FL=1
MVKPQKNTSFKKMLSIMIVTIIVALTIRFFVFEPYKIPTNTMSPTLMSGDLILVQKWPFGIHTPLDYSVVFPGRLPSYGEVVLYSPKNQPGINYLKRVIGLPGDHIQIKKGRVILNKKPLPFKSSSIKNCGIETINDYDYQVCLNPELIETNKAYNVPQNSVFVIGDFRSKKVSIKDWDIIPISVIRAKASFIWLSIDPHTNNNSKQSWTSIIRFDRVFSFIK